MFINPLALPILLSCLKRLSQLAFVSLVLYHLGFDLLISHLLIHSVYLYSAPSEVSTQMVGVFVHCQLVCCELLHRGLTVKYCVTGRLSIVLCGVAMISVQMLLLSSVG